MTKATNDKAAKLPKQVTSHDVDESVLTDKGGSRITSYARADVGSALPEDGDRINVTILSDLLDRWEGLSTTVDVWGTTPSLRFVTEALVDETIRAEVSDYFARRKFATTFKNLLPGIANTSRTFRPNDGLLNKVDIHRVLMAEYEPVTTGVIMELVLPTLIDLGLVSGNIKYSKHVRYPMKRVTAEDIQHDVAMYQVSQAVKAAKASAIDREGRYTVSVLGETLAEAFRPIGLALYEYHDLATIVDDIVKGVRAHLDPTLSGGSLKGVVPSDWRNHSVIAELAQNMVFVRAALAIPPRTTIAPQSEGWKLNQWAPTILAALKSSERYAWVSKTEVLRSFGVRKVRDVKGKVVASVLYRNARVQPVAQAVFAIEDAIMEGAYSIHATKDRIADAIQSAYGTADFSTATGADMVYNLLTDAVEAGWGGHRALYTIDMLDAGVDIVTVACMLSERLSVHANEKGVEVTSYTANVLNKTTQGDLDEAWQPKWWFSVKTNEINLDILSGSHLRTEVITCDPVEAILSAQEFDPLDAVAIKPQVLGPAAFNTTVVAFDSRILRNVGKRYSFSISVNDVLMQGAFKPSSFASMRSREMTSLVLPHFNEAVIYGYASAFASAQSILKAMAATTVVASEDDLLGDVGDVVSPAWRTHRAPGDEFFSFMKRRIARSLLTMAQRLSPAFRQEVHEAVISRSVARDDLSLDDSLTLRARLTQRTFAAACDMIALDFFLDTQGINVDVWREMLTDSEMIKVWMEMGSDRELAAD